MRFVMKNRYDNDVTNPIDVVYAENDTELSWLIGLGVDCDEYQIGQLHDWLYGCGLYWKWNRATMTNWTRSSLWQKPDKTMM